MIPFIRAFTNAIINPNDSHDAPLDQASTFIELVADPNVWAIVQIDGYASTAVARKR